MRKIFCENGSVSVQLITVKAGVDLILYQQDLLAIYDSDDVSPLVLLM
jgi:hypothetical protein